MKRPDSEMRGYRFQLAEHRREIGDLDRLAARLRQECDKIELRQKAAEAGSAPVTFDKALIERRAHIEQSLAGIEAQLHQARAGLSEAYHGMRGSEIAASVRAERYRRRKVG
ncbi:MAG TPA: hypothetical protein VN899_03710 [Stellaceae bacterium]|nr:hypothetical protein [Stellaceae bacterium]